MLQRAAKEGTGLLMEGKEPPPILQRLGCCPGQATPSHPDAGERRRGCGERRGWRMSGEEREQSDKRGTKSQRGRFSLPPFPEFPPRAALTPITTLSSPWKMGMNLSPRRISAWFRGRNRQSTLMLHSLLVSAMVVAGAVLGTSAAGGSVCSEREAALR
jgi:hypothetical protein